MSYKTHVMKLRNLREITPDSAQRSDSYVSHVIEHTGAAFAEIDWSGLEAEGLHKKDDYCFIYSYPPVRTLARIEPEALFEPSSFGALDGPVNLYIHIPYCTGICSYCYFAKVLDTDKAPIKRSDYPSYLSRELDMILAKNSGSPLIRSIHFGGGTPSTLNERELTSIMDMIRSMPLAPDTEITLECAPETLIADPDKPRMMIEAGVNRFNLGVESLDDTVLRIMGRRHGADETLRAMEILFKAGVNNLNVDVIYDLPGQNLASWVDTLVRLEQAGVHSISTYRLRKHPRKAISKLQADLYPAYDEGLKMQLAHGLVMQDTGFVRSSSHKYARGHEKLQKQVELKRGIGNNQLLSLGCGAYGFINGTFYWNTKSLSEYGDAIRSGRLPVWIGQILDADEVRRKAMVLGMHTNAGVPLAAFAEKYGIGPRAAFRDEIGRLERLGLLEEKDGHILPTELGRFFADEISLCFYSPKVRDTLDAVDMRYGMFFESDKYV